MDEIIKSLDLLMSFIDEKEKERKSQFDALINELDVAIEKAKATRSKLESVL